MSSKNYAGGMSNRLGEGGRVSISCSKEPFEVAGQQIAAADPARMEEPPCLASTCAERQNQMSE
jgi:hypothetical protein